MEENSTTNDLHSEENFPPAKDTRQLFSAQANAYALYRPDYPAALYDYILSFVQHRDRAWDCATGNGQAALQLSPFFHQVQATDISHAQLQNAVQKANIHYTVTAAEQTSFPADYFDLIAIATAYHWLQWDKFYEEAQRVGKHGCVVAAWAYNLVTSDDDVISEIIRRFYYDVMYTYWDVERRHVEAAYSTVTFNFSPLPSKDFFILRQWTKEQLTGYIATWSAVQHYIHSNGHSPIPILAADLATHWPGNGTKEFRFPLFLKIGRVAK